MFNVRMSLFKVLIKLYIFCQKDTTTIETSVQAKRKIQLKNNDKDSDEDDLALKNKPLPNFYGRNSYGNKIDTQGSKIDAGLTSKNNDSKTYNLRNGSNLNENNKVEIKQTSNKTIRNNREPESKHFISIYQLVIILQ